MTTTPSRPVQTISDEALLRVMKLELQRKAYEKNHADKRKKACAKYYETHKEKFAENHRRWTQTHKDVLEDYHEDTREQRNQHQRENYANDPVYKEKQKKSHKKWQQSHIQQRKKYMKDYNTTHKEHNKVVNAKYKETHAEQLRLGSAIYYQKNKAKIDAYQRNWCKTHPEEANKIHRAASHKYLVKVANAEGSFTPQEFEELCKKFDNRCAYCGKKRKLTPDHVVPLSRGGTGYISNILPACLKCNCSKQDLTYDEYMEYLKNVKTLNQCKHK